MWYPFKWFDIIWWLFRGGQRPIWERRLHLTADQIKIRKKRGDPESQGLSWGAGPANMFTLHSRLEEPALKPKQETVKTPTREFLRHQAQRPPWMFLRLLRHRLSVLWFILLTQVVSCNLVFFVSVQPLFSFKVYPRLAYWLSSLWTDFSHQRNREPEPSPLMSSGKTGLFFPRTT